MVKSPFSYSFPIGFPCFLWFSYGFSHEIPIFPWFSYGFPMFPTVYFLGIGPQKADLTKQKKTRRQETVGLGVMVVSNQPIEHEDIIYVYIYIVYVYIYSVHI